MSALCRGRVLTCLSVGIAIALVASVEIPRPGHVCRAPSNEVRAQESLKRIHDAQRLVRENRCLDRDGDGHFEVASIQELCGAVPGQTLNGPSDYFWSEQLPPPLSAGWGEPANGIVTRKGYCFEMWLPAKGGGWVPDHIAYQAPQIVDTARARGQWRCYAWPTSHGNSGFAAYAIDARGVVLEFMNAEGIFSARSGPGPSCIERFSPWEPED